MASNQTNFSNFIAKFKNTKISAGVIQDEIIKVDIKRPPELQNETSDSRESKILPNQLLNFQIKTFLPYDNSFFFYKLKETYTVDDAIEKLGFGVFQIKLAFLSGCAYV